MSAWDVLLMLAAVFVVGAGAIILGALLVNAVVIGAMARWLGRGR